MLKMDSARIVATVIFVGSIIMLGDAWLKKDQGLKVNMINAEQGVSTVPQAAISNSGNDEESLPSLSKITSDVGDYVQVNTDLFSAKIALLGGGIKELTLTKHHG